MPTIVFSQLIDAAIGSPDAGHVDFHALQLLLYHFAEKLELLNSTLEISSSGSIYNYVNKMAKRKKGAQKIILKRMPAGAADEPDDALPETDANVEETPTAEPEAPVEEDNVPELQEEPPEPIEEVVPEAVPEEIVPVEEEQPVEVPIIEEPIAEIPEASTATLVVDSPAQDVQEEAPKDIETISHRTVMSGKSVVIEEKIIPEGIKNGISIMKDQIELAMEQLNLLNNIAHRGKRGSYLASLKKLNHKMRNIQKANVFIEGGLEAPESSTEFISEEELEESAEEEMIKKMPTEMELVKEPTRPLEVQDLEYHLCYPPDKMMDQLLDLKSEYCVLTNKLNDIMIVLTEMDSQRTKVILSELQEQMRDVRYLVTVLKDGLEMSEQKQKSTTESMVELEKAIELFRVVKIDRTEMEILLADKVDYIQLERKVSHDYLKEILCRIEKQFCEVQRLINFNEKHALQVIENMRKNIGLDTIDQMLKDFRGKVDQDLLKLQSILQNYMDSTNDECAAAGARVKVLKDFACLSCDANCVMRTMEKSKIGKLPNSRGSTSLGPLITYELGSIRKSGIMGYYRKDEFPHSTHAWKTQQTAALKMCVPRHAGGNHTTHTAKDHMEKVVNNKRAK